MLVKTAIFLPANVVKKLPKGRVRAKGTFNEVPFSLGVQHKVGRGYYFSVSAPLRKAAGIKAGDKVKVIFKLVDPQRLDIPEELKVVLQQDESGMTAWKKLSTGYQRSLIHYITSVKNVDSRIRRSLQLVEKAKAGLLHAQNKKT